MHPGKFIEIIEEEYSALNSRQKDRWLRLLSKFDDNQLSRMLAIVLESGGAYRPKIGAVLRAARELGYMDKPASKSFPFQTDSMGSHDLCGGMGLLRVFFDVTANEERKPHKRLLAVKPANWAPKVGDETPGEGAEGIVYEFLYRCPCDAGARQPNSVPLWKTSTVETF